MSTSYILRLIKEALNHNLKFVYMDLAIRLVLNFYIYCLMVFHTQPPAPWLFSAQVTQ